MGVARCRSLLLLLLLLVGVLLVVVAGQVVRLMVEAVHQEEHLQYMQTNSICIKYLAVLKHKQDL